MLTDSDTEATHDETQPPRGYLALWHNRDYLLLWSGQGISSLGSQASQLALPLLILAATGSPAKAGLLGALRGLAYVLFGLPAGAFVDRWNRKAVMILCDLGRALAFASIPLALLLWHLNALHLYAVSFIEGTLFLFFGLAEAAALTRVVPRPQLADAVSQNQATESVATLLGPSLGGVLFGFGRALPFVADAVSYGVSALSLGAIRARFQEARPLERRALGSEIGEGVRWLWGQPVVRLLMVLNAGVNLLYGGWTLLLIELAQHRGASPAAIGLVFSLGGLGTIAGALLTPLAQRRFTVGQLMVGIAWLFAITWPPYALATSVLTLGLVNGLSFLFVPIFSSTQFSYRLALIPDALQGRVNSVFRLGTFGGQTLGFLLMGLLLERFGPIATVWITFVPALGLALVTTLSGPLRRAGSMAEVSRG